MHKAVMTTKGQVTIPAALRERLRLKQGDELQFLENPDGSYAVVPKNRDIVDSAGALADLPPNDMAAGDDPLGDILVEDDTRTKTVASEDAA